MMAILRKNNRDKFTVVSNEAIRDDSISLKALGLLVRLLSLPDDWEFSEEGLIKIFKKDGQASVRSGLKELESTGYLKRERKRDERGHMSSVEWTVYENPHLENPSLVIPNLDNRPQLNTKGTKDEETKDLNIPYTPPEGNECKDDFKKLLEQTMGFVPNQQREATQETPVLEGKQPAKRVSKRRKKHELTPEQTENFNRFWESYPKKKDKGSAIDAWMDINPDDELADRIIKSCEYMVKSGQWTTNRKDPAYQYIKYPSSWLNVMGWEDEDAQPPKTYSYEFTRIGGDSVEENALRNQVKVKVKENE